MTPEAAALIGAGIGAGGTVASQLGVGVLTRLSERSRLTLDRSSQVLELRKNTYGEFLHTARHLGMSLESRERVEEDRLDEAEKRLARRWERHIKRQDQLLSEVLLIEPELEDIAVEVHTKLVDWKIAALTTGDQNPERGLDFWTRLAECQWGMRVSLGLKRPGRVIPWNRSRVVRRSLPRS